MSKLTIHPNGVVLKIKNKRICVTEFNGGVKISVFSLTKETGKSVSTICKLLNDDKIKYSEIRFSEESLKYLYIGIGEYLKSK